MTDKVLTQDGIRKHIRKCIRYGKLYNFLGLVENRDLTPEAEALFSHPRIPGYWDWVNGNSKLRDIIEEEQNKAGMGNYEKLCRRMGFMPEKEKE